MPPRFVYWTIIAGGLPTAFRATEREELLPTFKRIQEKHPDAVMKYFARGRLWESAEEAKQEADARRARARAARRAVVTGGPGVSIATRARSSRTPRRSAISTGARIGSSVGRRRRLNRRGRSRMAIRSAVPREDRPGAIASSTGRHASNANLMTRPAIASRQA